MITNNIDLYNYMHDRGVWCTFMKTPSRKWNTDELVVAFPEAHVSNVSCNAHTDKYLDEYRQECKNIIDWLNCGSSRVIVVTPVIKFDSIYMYEHAREQYDRLRDVRYEKQVIHTKEIGELINPHRLQIRYKGIEPIKFDLKETKNIRDPHYCWIDKTSRMIKAQQMHYINVLNATTDKYERRKLRHIPEYALFSQLYKKLFTTK